MEELLIKQVRKHDFLYNHGCPSYRDQNIRRIAWDEIGNELKITGNHLYNLFNLPNSSSIYFTRIKIFFRVNVNINIT